MCLNFLVGSEIMITCEQSSLWEKFGCGDCYSDDGTMYYVQPECNLVIVYTLFFYKKLAIRNRGLRWLKN